MYQVRRSSSRSVLFPTAEQVLWIVPLNVAFESADGDDSERELGAVPASLRRRSSLLPVASADPSDEAAVQWPVASQRIADAGVALPASASSSISSLRYFLQSVPLTSDSSPSCELFVGHAFLFAVVR